ncbi:MATE family efflux transporter [Pyrofollis japonicus]|uniref:MATE family efflux transporter n=1 Tax=Pyrofollis japonicus TaxID=3060460 RepID=UPI00295A8856|nr:MATE family efflux transporter [Pyrofollis japonicus]BEP16672.1 MATE family efflux transporter [Pyrofollis japonicus]
MDKRDEVGSRLKGLRERVLTEPRLFRLILWLAAPLMVSMGISTIYEIVDTFWLSRLGKAALGAPIVSWPYPDILFGILFGLSSSISALVGQYVGAAKWRKAREAAGTVLGVMLLVAVPGSLAIMASAGLYLSAIGVPSDVKPLAEIYLTVLAAGIPLSGIYLFFTMTLSAMGDTTTPTKIGIASTLINFVLDPILIFGLLGLPRLGILGAALATFFSRVFSASYAAYSLATGRHGLRLSVGDLRPRPLYLRLAAHVSIPQIVQRLAMTLGFMTMAGIVSGLGTDVLAAYSIGQIIIGIDRIISMPFGRATGIIVAQALGAKMYERAKKALWTGLTALLVTISAFLAAIMLFAEPFAKIFSNDPNVIRITMDMIHIFAPSTLGFSIFMVANTIARSSGRTLFVSILGIARLWFMRVPLSWLLAYRLGMGEIGLWTGMAISNYATGLIALTWLLKGTWLNPIIHEGTE